MDGSNPSIWEVFKSVLASFFGVQKEKNASTRFYLRQTEPVYYYRFNINRRVYSSYLFAGKNYTVFIAGCLMNARHFLRHASVPCDKNRGSRSVGTQRRCPVPARLRCASVVRVY